MLGLLFLFSLQSDKKCAQFFLKFTFLGTAQIISQLYSKDYLSSLKFISQKYFNFRIISFWMPIISKQSKPFLCCFSATSAFNLKLCQMLFSSQLMSPGHTWPFHLDSQINHELAFYHYNSYCLNNLDYLIIIGFSLNWPLGWLTLLGVCLSFVCCPPPLLIVFSLSN